MDNQTWSHLSRVEPAHLDTVKHSTTESELIDLMDCPIKHNWNFTKAKFGVGNYLAWEVEKIILVDHNCVVWRISYKTQWEFPVILGHQSALKILSKESSGGFPIKTQLKFPVILSSNLGQQIIRRMFLPTRAKLTHQSIKRNRKYDQFTRNFGHSKVSSQRT